MRFLSALLACFVVSTVVCFGQLHVGSRHTRLIVPDHMEFIVDTPELIVDTLIMDNHSTLRFTGNPGKLCVVEIR